MAATVQELDVSMSTVEITTPLSTHLTPEIVGDEQDEIIDVIQVVTAPIETANIAFDPVTNVCWVQPLGVSRGVKNVEFAPVRG